MQYAKTEQHKQNLEHTQRYNDWSILILTNRNDTGQVNDRAHVIHDMVVTEIKNKSG